MNKAKKYIDHGEIIFVNRPHPKLIIALQAIGPTIGKWSKTGFGYFSGGPPGMVEKWSKSGPGMVGGLPK